MLIVRSLLFAFIFLLQSTFLFAQEKFPYQLPSQIATALEQDTMDWKYQIAATEYSFIGAYKETMDSWDASQRPFPDLEAEEKAYFNVFEPVNAVEYITERAAEKQIVIINEAHHQPLHRVFTAQLLQGLYDVGYRYLGLETLSRADQELNERKYPLIKTGYYSREPQFGNLIREALRIGYTLFPYESEDHENGKEREIKQARNIQKVLEEHLDAKMLIHCGYAHVVEGEYRAWEKAMAGRLKEYTGIDPLTINQEKLTEAGSPAYHNPYLGAMDIAESSVFVREDGAVFNGPEGYQQYDLRVAHPFTKFIHGRPSWLLEGGDKQWVDIPIKKISLDFPVLVLAYRAEESKDAVPVDIVPLDKLNSGKKLALFPGKYRLLIRNAAGEEQEVELR